MLLPEHLSGPDPARADALVWFLTENPGVLGEALDLEVDYIDARAQYTDHEINDIGVNGSAVHVDFTVYYYVYYGCDDMNNEFDEDRQGEGRWYGPRLLMEIPDRPPERYPSEEL